MPIVVSLTVPVVLVCETLCNRFVQNLLLNHMLNEEGEQCLAWRKSAYSPQLKHDCDRFGALFFQTFLNGMVNLSSPPCYVCSPD